MRTGLFLLAGFLLIAVSAIMARLFTENYPSAATWCTGLFVVVWLALTGFNMWTGVAKAGYSASEELPIFLMLFGIPAVAALLLKWKLL